MKRKDVVSYGDYQRDFQPKKPKEAIKKEYDIKTSLIEQGVDPIIAAGVVGYRPEQIPFTYATKPHEVYDGSGNRGKMLSSIWIGTTAPIADLIGRKNLDQLPEVIVQWRGHSDLDGKNNEVTRLEAHPVGNDGTFVEIEYRGVSNMGQFDGMPAIISVHVPKRDSTLHRTYSGRKEYSIYGVGKNDTTNEMFAPWKKLVRPHATNHRWSLDMSGTNLSRTTILNGLSEVRNFHLPDVTLVRENKQYKRLSAPIETLLSGGGDQNDTVVGINPELTQALEGRVNALFIPIVSEAMQLLKNRKCTWETQGMSADGILSHPEKISIPELGKTLADLTADQRIHLAQIVEVALAQGEVAKWLSGLKGKEQPLISGLAAKNTTNLLAWLSRGNATVDQASNWIAKAEQKVVKENRERLSLDNVLGSKSYSSGDFVTDEYQRCLDGALTSVVEAYIGFMARKHSSKFLK